MGRADLAQPAKLVCPSGVTLYIYIYMRSIVMYVCVHREGSSEEHCDDCVYIEQAAVRSIVMTVCTWSRQQ